MKHLGIAGHGRIPFMIPPKLAKEPNHQTTILADFALANAGHIHHDESPAKPWWGSLKIGYPQLQWRKKSWIPSEMAKKMGYCGYPLFIAISYKYSDKPVSTSKSSFVVKQLWNALRHLCWIATFGVWRACFSKPTHWFKGTPTGNHCLLSASLAKEVSFLQILP